MRDKLPIPSRSISLTQLLDITGSSQARVTELIELGWISPAQAGEDYLFLARDAYRIRKLERLCADFELHSVGGSIIVDLLERLEMLERQVRELRRMV